MKLNNKMHPKVREAYSQAGFQMPATPQDAREEQFRRRTKRAREDEVKTFINQVYRISQGPNKDFIFYEQKEVGPDLAGNEDTFTDQKGRYDLPKFRKVYDPTSGDVSAVQLSGSETVYEYPYSKGKMEEILNKGDSSNTNFTLIVGNRKYGGFTAEDFINKPFDELAEMALSGEVGISTGGKTTIGKLRQQGGQKQDKDKNKEEEEEGKTEQEEGETAEERIKRHQEEEKKLAEEFEQFKRARLSQAPTAQRQLDIQLQKDEKERVKKQQEEERKLRAEQEKDQEKETDEQRTQRLEQEIYLNPALRSQQPQEPPVESKEDKDKEEGQQQEEQQQGGAGGRTGSGNMETNRVKENVQSILRKPQEAFDELRGKNKQQEQEEDEEPTFNAASEEEQQEQQQSKERQQQQSKAQGKKGR